jgi:serine protease inhibitor ecotin
MSTLVSSNQTEAGPSYPVAGYSLQDVSFYDFIESKDIELRKQIELKNASLIIGDLMQKMGFGGVIGHGIQIVDSIKHIVSVERQELLITFTKEAIDKYKAGAAKFVIDGKTGLTIPQFRDVVTGRFMEHGKIIESFKSTPELIKQMSTAAIPGLIAIAHMISNYDISKQLKQIGKDIEFLKSARMYDQKAELIASYGMLRQVFFLPEPHRSVELGRIHYELQRLRNVWALECEGILKDTRDDRGKLKRALHIQQGSVNERNRKMLDSVQERLTLMGYSARLDIMAIVMGNVKVNKKDELRPLERIDELLQRSYASLPKKKSRETVKIELNTVFDNIKQDCDLLFSNIQYTRDIDYKYNKEKAFDETAECLFK